MPKLYGIYLLIILIPVKPIVDFLLLTLFAHDKNKPYYQLPQIFLTAITTGFGGFFIGYIGIICTVGVFEYLPHSPFLETVKIVVGTLIFSIITVISGMMASKEFLNLSTQKAVSIYIGSSACMFIVTYILTH
jgi:hypothetical protein